jgi:hypothetical protein
VPPLPSKGPSDPMASADRAFAQWLGEWLRRVALGLTAALIAARAFWPSEPGNLEESTGNGLLWILALLLTAGLGIAGALIGGGLKVRWSWADLAVYLLMLWVGLSAAHADERRMAINLAWEWGALGLAYALLRNLPRTRGESLALAAVLTATAVAVASYGLYQVAVELPQVRAYYQRHTVQALREAGITPEERKHFEDRLLGSQEPFATFALANSLAGFLLGPTVLALAVALENLFEHKGQGSRFGALALAAPPGLILLLCLLLTKSRSAYLGLLVGVAVLAWNARKKVPARGLALAGLVLLGGIMALVAVAWAKGQLDPLVLTESTKSLRYRWEYWQGTWRAIWGFPQAWWQGFGPGNFAEHYLRYKLPQSSEEIFDPHNMLLEVWATAGLPALVAFVAALGIALFNLLRPSPEWPAGPDAAAVPPRRDPAAPPQRATWVVVCGGLSWLVAVVVGPLNPFAGALTERWLILGMVWLWASVLGMPLWQRRPIPALSLGAAALAEMVHLLGAGGIGIPAVALGFWTLIALGLNLRDDRPCAALHPFGRRGTAFSLALVWSALVGTFAGAILPYWKCQGEMEVAQLALNRRTPDFQKARDAYSRACAADQFAVQPWLELADVEYRYWLSGQNKATDELIDVILLTFKNATEPPKNATEPPKRNPNSYRVESLRAAILRDILIHHAQALKPFTKRKLEAQLVDALAKAAAIYPASAARHADLALAIAELAESTGQSSLLGDAVREANEALRLDEVTPHLDKKLPAATRQHLKEQLPVWSKRALPDEPTAQAPAASGNASRSGPSR